MCFGIFWNGYLNLEVEEVLKNDGKNLNICIVFLRCIKMKDLVIFIIFF